MYLDVMDFVHKIATRRTLDKLLLLGDPEFYRFLIKVALPNYLELRRTGLHVGTDVTIHSSACITTPDWVTIGDGSSIGAFSNLRPSAYGIRIGKHTLIAQHVSIIGSNHIYQDPDKPIKVQGFKEAPVVIGDDCWIGCNSVILPGVNIGDGAVVAAGSVVTKLVEPYTVVAGVPARFIRHRE